MFIKKGIFVVSIILFISNFLHADTTYVSGTISGRWDADDSPYMVTGNLHLMSDSTLIIEPGVSVIFTGHYKLYVDTSATFIAVGTEIDSITFTALDTVFTDSTGGYGGIKIDNATDACSLVYCRIEFANTFGAWPDHEGGAVFCYGSDLTFMNNNLIKNQAGRDGGGAVFWYCDPIIVGNTFAFNSAGSNGGGLSIRYSLRHEPDMWVTGNLIYGNSAYSGGGIQFGDADPHFVNNLVFSNSARYGGGIRCSHGSPIMINNTIVGNHAEFGSGMVCRWESSPISFNNIFYNDVIAEGMEVFLEFVEDHPSLPYFAYNNIDTSSYASDSAGGTIDWLEGNFAGNPMLAEPFLHLTPGSPCIDAGIDYIWHPLEGSDSMIDAPTVDFEGNPRPLGDGWDVGAFEFEPGTVEDTVPPCITWGYPDSGSTDVPVDTMGTLDICGACETGPETWVDSSSISLYYSPLTEPTYSIELPFDLEVIRCMGYQVRFNFAEYPLPYDTDIELCVDAFDIAGNPASECIIFHTARLDSTFVCGEVSGHWTPDRSPYFVDCELHVPTDSTLIIEPGCSVIFLGHYKFCVDSNAVLKVIGSEEDSIVFTAIDTHLTDSTGGHHGIRFFSAAEGCSLVYCVIEYGNAFGDYIIDQYGGGILCLYSEININNSNIRNNLADGPEGHGGGIFLLYSHGVISNNTIDSNTGREGSGISLHNSDPLICYNTISLNNSRTSGGGILCYEANPEISANIISENSAFRGGGISCDYISDATISNNRITHNYAHLGGGISSYESDPVIMNNIISSNTAEEVGGGGISSFDSDPVIMNNVIFLNYAEESGGGLNLDNSDVVLVNNTIYGNGADNYGGGIYCFAFVNLTIINTIFENNDAPEGNEIFLDSCEIDYYPCSLYISHSVIDPDDCHVDSGAGVILWGSGNIGDDPLFADDSIFHLAEGSPCIDAGAEFVISPWGDTVYAPYEDFEGDTRPQGDGWDIGADESPFSFIPGKTPTLPTSWSLTTYPNPFNAELSINYDVPQLSKVKITIHNILGDRVATLIDEYKMPGSYVTRWQASDGMPSGIYFCRMKAEEIEKFRRILLIK